MSKKMFAIVLALILALGVAGNALAATAVKLKLNSKYDTYYEFTPETTDLFENFKGLMPGDKVSQEILVENTTWHGLRIWLRAEPVNQLQKDFLDQLKLTVTADNGKIFEAVAGEQDGLAPTKERPWGVPLGVFDTNGKTTLTATIEVPIELGNEYMGQMGIVPWTFTVEEVNLNTTPETGDSFTMWVWVAVAAVLAAGIVILLMKQRKQRTEN